MAVRQPARLWTYSTSLQHPGHQVRDRAEQGQSLAKDGAGLMPLCSVGHHSCVHHAHPGPMPSTPPASGASGWLPPGAADTQAGHLGSPCEPLKGRGWTAGSKAPRCSCACQSCGGTLELAWEGDRERKKTGEKQRVVEDTPAAVREAAEGVAGASAGLRAAPSCVQRSRPPPPAPPLHPRFLP